MLDRENPGHERCNTGVSLVDLMGRMPMPPQHVDFPPPGIAVRLPPESEALLMRESLPLGERTSQAQYHRDRSSDRFQGLFIGAGLSAVIHNFG